MASLNGSLDDRWEPEGMSPSPRSSLTHKSIGMKDLSLPAIGGTSSVSVVPTPTPQAPTLALALANKSKLKPPTQRSTRMPVLLSSAMGASGQVSPLKLPSLVKSTAKPAETVSKPNNQEMENDELLPSGFRDASSSRSLLASGPRGSAVDKHRDFIKVLEEQKRKEKDSQAKQDERRRKMQKKRAEKILHEAALARQKPVQVEEEVPEENVTPEASEPADGEEDEETRQREKEAKRQRQRLLKKQQALLETLQNKKREKQEEEELEKERERRRQHKLKKAVLDAIHASKADEVYEDEEGEMVCAAGEEASTDRSDGSPAKSVAEQEEAEGETSENQPKPRKSKHHRAKSTKHHRHREPEEAVDRGLETLVESTAAVSSIQPMLAPQQRRDSTRHVDAAASSDKELQKLRVSKDAVHKKQHEYLQKLTEQRRLKQQEDEDAKLAQEKRRRRVQLEAQQRLQEAASKAQQQRLQDEQNAAEHEQEEEKKVVVDVHAMVARLSKLKDKDAQVIPEARDFVSWKKRHGVRSDQKVFSMTGWYPVIRECLEQRGWFYNDERGSPFFDLKWSLKSDDLKGIKLKEDQYVNHFFSNTAITTKVGLLHTLRGLPWHQSVDTDTVFPRAYDLNEPRDMDAFVMDFRYTFAEGVLKEVAKRITLASKQSVRLNEAFVSVLLAVGRKKIKAKWALFDHGQPSAAEVDPLDESVDDVLSAGVDEPVSDLEWEVLTKHQLDAPGKLRASLAYRKRVFADDRDSSVLPSDPQGPTGAAPIVDTVLSALEKKQERHTDKLRLEAFNRDKASLGEQLSRVSVLSASKCDELLQLTATLAGVCPQFHLNGGGDLASTDPEHKSRNVWIVKPAGLSRGRGIRVFNQLDALLQYADVENHKECQWVAQKYIENPLLICQRKFDIRQWVLVTSWDPLTVWIYQDFYLRFSSEAYSTDDLTDQYVHLTNNSIQKNSDKFHDVYTTDDGAVQVEGNMLHSDAFRQYIAQRCGVDDSTYHATLRAQMTSMVIQSLQCAQDLVQHRKNACELYGYDFMLDESLRPWLIEVNSSPACDYSTPTAQRYVETGLAGIIQVIVDHREYEQRKKSGAAGVEPEPDTGSWRRVHKGELVGKPVASFGADFQVKGTKVVRSRNGGRKAKKKETAAGGDEEESDGAARGDDERTDDQPEPCDRAEAPEQPEEPDEIDALL